MANYEWLTNEFAPAFCRMLLHSLWMGVAAALLTVIIIISTKNTSAVIRYNWLVVLFIAVVLAAGITFFRELKIVSLMEVSSSLLVDDNKETINITAQTDRVTSSNANLFYSIIAFLDRNSIGIVTFWFFVFLFKIVRVVVGLRHIHVLQRQKVHPVDESWLQWIKEKSYMLGIQRSIVFLQSELVKIPVAIGYLKPIILVPLGLLSRMPPHQVESILIHEIAHIKRKDYLVNVLQSFIDAVFFFNPALIWLSSLIREEREKCCDDIAVLHSNRKDYLEALVSFQNIQYKEGFAMGLGAQNHSLLNRVKKIIDRKNSRLSSGELYLLLLAVAITTFSFIEFNPTAKPLSHKEKISQPEKYFPVKATGDKKKANGIYKVAFNNHKDENLPTLSSSESNNKINDTLVYSNRDTVPLQTNDTEVGILKSGQTYMIRRKDNKIIDLHVDGKEIPKQEYSKYHSVIEDIEKNNKVMDSKKLSMEARRSEMEQRRNEMKLRHATMQGEMAKRQQYQSINSSRKTMENKRDAMLTKQTELRSQLSERKKLRDSVKNIMNERRDSTRNSMKSRSIALKAMIASIINDLIADNIIHKDSQLSFSLSSDRLIVNGVTQSQFFISKFASKYLKSPKNYIIYSNLGGAPRIQSYIE